MSTGSSIVNLGDLTKPATTLIEKISEAIGGIFRPSQIRRIAEAEAQAEKIKAVSQIEITDLQRRAVDRFVFEEARKQQNIESITAKALPELTQAATPEKLEDDWITSFFDKCRLISDEEMQTLWAKVLAGEASSPGQFSKRTVNLLSSLDKSDAEMFMCLCSFSWCIENTFPLVYDFTAPIYTQAGIGFGMLNHLDSIGLVSFEAGGGYRRQKLPQRIIVSYQGYEISITFPKPEDNDMSIGHVLFSKAGKELASICAPAPVPGFLDYTIDKWKSEGLQIADLAPSPEAGV